MMKKTIILILLMIVTISTFGQVVTDSTASVTYSFGDSFSVFLQKNMWTLAFTAFFILSEWLGSTGKVKEGSVFALVLNWIGKFLRTKTDVVTTKKAKFMNENQYRVAKSVKVVILAMVLTGLGISASGQNPMPRGVVPDLPSGVVSERKVSPWSGFFKPISSFNLIEEGDKSPLPAVWYFRPAVSVSALQLTYNKDSKGFDASSLTAAGIGISYAHFINTGFTPYSDYGFNLLCLFDTQINGSTPAGVSLAGTVSAFQFVSVGAGYSFPLKTPFIITGITFNFNK